MTPVANPVGVAMTSSDRIRNSHLRALADLGYNLFQRVREHEGIAYLDGATADEAGSLALERFATELGRMVVVGSDSQHHSGKAFLPAGTVGEPFNTASADTHPKGGDAEQAPFMSGAVAESETPKASRDTRKEGP